MEEKNHSSMVQHESDAGSKKKHSFSVRKGGILANKIKLVFLLLMLVFFIVLVPNMKKVENIVLEKGMKPEDYILLSEDSLMVKALEKVYGKVTGNIDASNNTEGDISKYILSNNQRMIENKFTKSEDIKVAKNIKGAICGSNITIRFAKYDEKYSNKERNYQIMSFVLGSQELPNNVEKNLIGMQVGSIRKITIPKLLAQKQIKNIIYEVELQDSDFLLFNHVERSEVKDVIQKTNSNQRSMQVQEIVAGCQYQGLMSYEISPQQLDVSEYQELEWIKGDIEVDLLSLDLRSTFFNVFGSDLQYSTVREVILSKEDLFVLLGQSYKYNIGLKKFFESYLTHKPDEKFLIKLSLMGKKI